MDSLYFGTYNTCDLTAMRKMTADDFEFYHDRGGLDTSAVNYIAAIKNNICGKVTRELVPGSIEVYPIANYGAVEIGYHRFINKAEGNHVSRPGKFIVIWHKTAEGWQMSRVVSLH
ncbi:MAG: nuclear transport factor 2 family protein [Mucilaginibacter polytrichastri]|nr:nuclear transport factor 2 family protein [Mucilaginibacter polytrichastri]